jgi:ribosomal protein S12 methylthiotransferase accessory factor
MQTEEVKTKTDLAETLRTFQNAIPNGDAYEFELTALDRLDIPLWGAFVWSESGDFSDGFGYGAGNLGARVSAWGEVLENYYATKTLETMPRRTASYAELSAANEAAVDPVTLCLDAGADYSPEKKIVWTRGKNYPAVKDVWLPLEAVAIASSDIAAEIAPKDFLFTPITNGLGAGASLEQALAHGILELVQRDGDSVMFRAMDEGIIINLDEVESEETRRLLSFLDENDIEIYVKLAGISCGMPVIYVVGHDRDLSRAPFQLSLSACGEAAHPNREIALAKALREYVSSRARKRFMHGSLEDMRRTAPEKYSQRVMSDEAVGDESRALKSVLNWLSMSREEFFATIRSPLFDVRRTINFSDLPTVKTEAIDAPDKLLKLIEKNLKQENLEIYYADFTPENSPFAVVKAIVPGLEVETMSYNRIGRRNYERLHARGMRDAQFRGLVGSGTENKPADAQKIHLTETDERAIGGAAWLSPQGIEKAVGKLYALYREPNGHTAGKILAEKPTANKKN